MCCLLYLPSKSKVRKYEQNCNDTISSIIKDKNPKILTFGKCTLMYKFDIIVLNISEKTISPTTSQINFKIFKKMHIWIYMWAFLQCFSLALLGSWECWEFQTIYRYREVKNFAGRLVKISQKKSPTTVLINNIFNK